MTSTDITISRYTKEFVSSEGVAMTKNVVDVNVGGFIGKVTLGAIVLMSAYYFLFVKPPENERRGVN